MADALPTPALPCPECRLRWREKDHPEDAEPGRHRIGNKRNSCRTCNAFAQRVMRVVRREMQIKHQDEYDHLRVRIEHDLYAQVLEDWTRLHPEDSDDPKPFGFQLDENGMPIGGLRT